MTLTDEAKQYLNTIYHNAKHPAAFSTLDVLYRHVKSHNRFNLSRKEVEDFLLANEVYTTHVGKHRPKHWSKIIVPYEKYMYEFDTAHLNTGDKIKHFVIGVDAFSKKADARPVPNLKADTVSRAMSEILDSLGNPAKIRVDRGTEYINATVRDMLRERDVKVFHSYAPKKSQIVERLIGHIKQRLYKLLQHKGSKKWSHFLPDVMKGYNRRVHRTIAMAPNNVKASDESKLWFKKKHEAFDAQPLPSEFKYRIGDSVRIIVPKGLYSKSYDEKFSAQIYYIASRFSPQNINRYKVKDGQNELLGQSFSESELERVIVNEDTEYRVEKVLERKKRA